MTYYLSLVGENAEKFKEFSVYVIAYDYFSKKPFVVAILSAGLYFISRLWKDIVLKYKYYGK